MIRPGWWVWCFAVLALGCASGSTGGADAGGVDAGGVDAGGLGQVDPGADAGACWSEPEVLSLPATEQVSLAVDRDGRALIAWVGEGPANEGPGLYLSRREVDGGWVSAERAVVLTTNVDELTLSSSASGVLALTWHEVAQSPSGHLLRAALYLPVGGWQPPFPVQRLDNPETMGGLPSGSALDAEGNLFVIWGELLGPGSTPQTAVRRYEARTGQWQPATRFPNLHSSSLATNSAGGALLAFGAEEELRVAQWSRDGGWRDELLASGPMGVATAALGPSGEAVVAWQENSQSAASVRGARVSRRVGSQWSTEPLPWPDGGTVDLATAAIVGAHGQLAVAGIGIRGLDVIGTVSTFDGTAWSAPWILDPAPGDSRLALAVNDRGVASLAWVGGPAMAARLEQPSFTIATPVVLDAAPGWLDTSPRLAVTAQGVRWALFQAGAAHLPNSLRLSHCP